MAQYGSLINSLYANSESTQEPQVGDGVTYLHWSDRSPGTITGITRFKTGARKGEVKGIIVQGDEWERVSGSAHDGSLEVKFLVNLRKGGAEFKLNKKGRFERNGTALALGGRDYYYDPHF